MNIHEKYIIRCIELAKNGLGTTYPNPMVGSVIVLDGKIIGEGWHLKAGGPHAEVNAINSVKDKSLLKKATIYVNLEPCSHYGKTPPCVNLIVEKQIKKVVIGNIDTNSEVSGRGVAHLKKNGCEVLVGVLKEDCERLNKRFFTFHAKKRPFILLKWAESRDGFMDKLRTENSTNKPNWISNQYSQQLVHKMRAEEQAVLVGKNTALNDNPRLTIRSWYGENPIRIVLDSSLMVPINSCLYDGTAETIIVTDKIPDKSIGNKVIFKKRIIGKSIPHQICDILFKSEIQSVIIEGGCITLQTFIKENLWDEAYVFVGESLFKDGLIAPELKKVPNDIKKMSNDTLYFYVNDC